MNKYHKFFVCKECKGTSFVKISQFRVNFKEVNFSEDLVYDEARIDRYRCLGCDALYTYKEIEEGTKEIIRKYKLDYWEKELK